MSIALAKSQNRNYQVDLLRGVAIVLMVIFHFSYDLTAFGWANFNTSSDIEWRIFRSIIVSCFLLAVGMSSYLAYRPTINKTKLMKTAVKLIAVSMLITVGSLIMHPNTWVYFGIIHFITVALLISVLFVNTPNLALILGISSILGYWLGFVDFTALFDWGVVNVGIPKQTVDLVSIFPWIGVVLIGIFVMHHALFGFTYTPDKISNKLVFLGQHSLIIYLIHQPILYALFGLLDFSLGR